MPYKKNIAPAVTATAAGIGILWLTRRVGDMPSLSTWEQVLAKEHGRIQVQRLAEKVRQRYKLLLADRSLPVNPVLRRHVTENILSGLALYQVLLHENSEDRQATLTEIDEAFRASTLAKNRIEGAVLRFLPNPFSLFKLAFAMRMKAFSTEGWDFEYVENCDERIAFNATRCFYLNALTSYGFA